MGYLFKGLQLVVKDFIVETGGSRSLDGLSLYNECIRAQLVLFVEKGGIDTNYLDSFS